MATESALPFIAKLVEEYNGEHDEKGSEGDNAITEMMNMMMSDLEKDLAAMKVNEKDAQEDYEQFIADPQTGPRRTRSRSPTRRARSRSSRASSWQPGRR